MVHNSMIQLLNLHAFWTQMKQWKISEANENAVLEPVGNRNGSYCCCTHAQYNDLLFSPSGATFKWLRHSPRIAACEMGEKESIYITNISNHFETIRKMEF